MCQSVPGTGSFNTEQVIEMYPSSWANKLTIISCNLKGYVLQGRGNVTKVFVWCFFEVHLCQSVLNLKIKLFKLNKRSDASLPSTGVKQ